jgi:hypothetical protein
MDKDKIVNVEDYQKIIKRENKILGYKRYNPK